MKRELCFVCVVKSGVLSPRFYNVKNGFVGKVPIHHKELNGTICCRHYKQFLDKYHEMEKKFTNSNLRTIQTVQHDTSTQNQSYQFHLHSETTIGTIAPLDRNEIIEKIDSNLSIIPTEYLIQCIKPKHCTCCHNSDVPFKSITKYGFEQTLIFSCSNCKKTYTFRTCPKDLKLNKHIIQSYELSSGTYESLSTFSKVVELPLVSKGVYYQYANKLWNNMSRLLNQEMNEELFSVAYQRMKAAVSLFMLCEIKICGKSYYLGNEVVAIIYLYVCGFAIPLDISVDARYSSRRNAHECTLIVFETKFKKIIERSHVIKKRTLKKRSIALKGCLDIFVGASKLMEPEACKMAITSLQHKSFPLTGHGLLHFKINSYVHDKDSTVSTIIKKLEPTAEEKLDPNHVVRNVRKEAKERIPRVAVIVVESFRKCIKMTSSLSDSEAEKKLKKLLTAYPYHLQNDHSKCDEGCPGTTKSQKLITKEEAIIVQEIFDKRIKYCHKFCNSEYNSQTNESLHSTICHTTPKTLDFSHNYCGRADLAIGQRLMGKFCQLRKIQKFTEAPFIMSKIDARKLDAKYEQDKIRKQSKTYKVRRVELRKANKETKPPPPSKGMIGKCTCSKSSTCKKACPCKKAGKPCTSKCSCSPNKCTNNKKV
ncbi:predicted protein [Naegleria gruberi]|uniref:Predicted protein n=1 Tax=Naegleria gruberi TaxID=5762 RepID=D2V395_NAEGR|nr:uncharacterized protein NAEGRDRAFT_46350 [Naegleria gruberi]EFC48732.1 predicted protein [Naegleria gruberi]|eukprot:XP_002681476.1 predicted protein [Naegleria gruberi strain NEG-M]